MQHHLLERSLYLCRSLDKTSCSNVIRLTAFAQVVKCHGDTEIAHVVRSFHFQDFLVSGKVDATALNVGYFANVIAIERANGPFFLFQRKPRELILWSLGESWCLLYN